MNTYERPTLSMISSFKELTGLAALGTRETLVRHQLLCACTRCVPSCAISGSVRGPVRMRHHVNIDTPDEEALAL
jgi:hypothetical protein